MTSPPLCAAPDPAPRRPRHPIPAGACDCHFHVFDAPSPHVVPRSYTAPPAPLRAYDAMRQILGVTRSVIVQPSIYSTDNRTTLQAMDGSMKAVVVVDDSASTETLVELDALGAVGARANLLFASSAQLDNLTGLGRNLAALGWHLQILADVSTWTDMHGFLSELPVPVVFDHMGHVPAARGANDPGFVALLRALETGQVWVKLSGAYRLSQAAPDYPDVAPLARALIRANPERLVWGSDWPHPSFAGPMPNDGDLLDLLFDWAGPETAQRILVQNPETLYGFAPHGA